MMHKEHREGTEMGRVVRVRAHRVGKALALLAVFCLMGGLTGCELEVYDRDRRHHRDRDYDYRRDHDRDRDRHHDGDRDRDRRYRRHRDRD